MTAPEDAVEARPWRQGDGPKPKVWTWPLTDPPALWVHHKGTWRWASVSARPMAGRPDGRTAYQVLIDTDGTTSRTFALFPGTNVARVASFSSARLPSAR